MIEKKILFTIITIMMLSIPTEYAYGLLAEVPLDTLIQKSDLILLGVPKKIELYNDHKFMQPASADTGMHSLLLSRRRGGGEAEITPGYFLKGSHSGNIKIKWSSEVHDQGIGSIGEFYLFFLQKGDSEYMSPAMYGRSCMRVFNASYSGFPKENIDNDSRVASLFTHKKVIRACYPQIYINYPPELITEIEEDNVYPHNSKEREEIVPLIWLEKYIQNVLDQSK